MAETIKRLDWRLKNLNGGNQSIPQVGYAPGKKGALFAADHQVVFHHYRVFAVLPDIRRHRFAPNHPDDLGGKVGSSQV